MGRKELKTIIVCEFSPSNAIVNAFDWLINYNVLTIFIWFNWIKYLVESLVKMPSNAGTFWAMVHLKRRCTMSILSDSRMKTHEEQVRSTEFRPLGMG